MLLGTSLAAQAQQPAENPPAPQPAPAPDPAKAAEQVDQLTKLLGTFDDKQKSTDPLKAAIVKLAAAIKVPDPQLGPNLTILRAWYGDFRFIRKAINGRIRLSPDTGAGPRVCDATAEVRGVCQGKNTCPIVATPQAPNPAQLDVSGPRLCAEDPTPHAAKNAVGLVIEFECVKLTKDGWTSVENNPKAMGTSDQRVHRALRANSSMVIRCVSDAS